MKNTITNYLGQYKNLKNEFEEKKEKSEAFKERLETLEEIILAIQGLKKTKKKYQETEAITSGKKKEPYYGWRSYDPGKYDTAYFFVKRISEEGEIIASKKFKPQIYEKCPECKKETPVLMLYEQTEDSPEGDTWEAEAFIICCDKIHEIKHISSGDRFFDIE